jgi:hypothetical protein
MCTNEELFGTTGPKLPAVMMLWDTAIKAAGQIEAPERNANNYSYPVIAAYHRARLAIIASTPGMTDWIAGRALHEIAGIVRRLNNPQPALFDFGRAA